MAAIDHLLQSVQSKLDLGNSIAQSTQSGNALGLAFRAQDAAASTQAQEMRAQNAAAFEMSVRAGKAFGEAADRGIQKRQFEQDALLRDRAIGLQEDQLVQRKTEHTSDVRNQDRLFGLQEDQFGLQQAEFDAGAPIRDAQGRIANKVGRHGGTPANLEKHSVRGDFSTVTADDLTPHLSKSLGQYSQDFIDAGKKYGLDPRFLASIAKLETANGTSSAFRNKKNGMGVSNASGPISFSDVRSSIMAQAASLSRQGGHYQGANTVGAIGKIYAPPGAGNDPNGTNGGWGKHVGGFYSDMLGASSGRVTHDLVQRRSEDGTGVTGPVANTLPAQSGGPVNPADFQQTMEFQTPSNEEADGIVDPETDEEAAREMNGTRPTDKYYNPDYVRELSKSDRNKFVAQTVRDSRALRTVELDLTKKLSQAQRNRANLERQRDALSAEARSVTGMVEAESAFDQPILEAQIAEAEVIDQLQSVEMEKMRINENLEIAKPEFKNLPEAAQKKMNALLTVKGDLDTIEAAYAALPDSKKGKVSGAWEKFKSGFAGTDEFDILNAAIVSAVPNFARGVAGEVGVLTDKDMARYASLFANAKTPEQVAMALGKMMRDKIDREARAFLDTSKGANFDTGDMRSTFQAYQFNVHGAGLDPNGDRHAEVTTKLADDEKIKLANERVEDKLGAGPKRKMINGNWWVWDEKRGKAVPEPKR